MTGNDQPREIADLVDVLADHGFLVEHYESEVEFGRPGFVIDNAHITYAEDHDRRVG